MADMAALDRRYFIDAHVYNCPFCNRRHVKYIVLDQFSFNWTDEKRCHGYLVRCESCKLTSMHLSFTAVKVRHTGWIDQNTAVYTFAEPEDRLLDDLFFYSVPTSFFVLDARIPVVLRELMTEAEGCLKSNFLTGASACARKTVYELAVLQDAEGENYEDRIKSLKKKLPHVEESLFDTLLTIQQVTSEKVHENAYDGWQSRHLRVILAALSEVLNEIYVVPALRAERRKAVLQLKDDVLKPKAVPRPAVKNDVPNAETKTPSA